MKKQDRIAYLKTKITEQRRWIEDHGNDRMGYIARYGSSSAPVEERRGDGGERIYEADRNELRKLEDELAELTQ